MTAYDGSLVLLKIGNGASPVEAFTTLGGLSTTQMEHRNQALDASHLGSGAWRKSLTAAGMQHLTVSGTGRFNDSAAEESLRSAALSNSARNFELLFGNGDKVSGAFQIISYERSGDLGSAESYSLTLTSSGPLTFTVA
jgi:TP901-1 family phage major tail protein